MKRRHLLQLLAGVPAAAALAACGKRKASSNNALKPGARVLALGDSLTFGYGAPPDASWPVKLGELTGWQVDNEGVNGDTSAGALQRLPTLLNGASYDAILIAIGGNDMLRGVPATATRDNIAALIEQARAHTPHVAVLATPAPDAMRAFVGSLSDAPFYEEVSKAGQALLLADVYSSVLSDASLRSDRIHANAQGYAKIAQQLADKLKAAGWR
ncbi:MULTISPECIES: GDSL-type esterase/lipase family protein [Variovorax]|jgi:acyl-CoA thioesterase I|uniref:GDSL-type esterase/lipase family protein n=1 Tax=Variovorax TaxID=34072 RepID=UPI00086BF246|nr:MULTISPECIES: GDSL-type esterase/lipase family protein [Variovorax]MBN8755305.1 GDSL family lipase [Variovorax sp.]ODU15946.1 MAG: GDSL family lipase [Variovorax sp. SCN 67-85]ODV21295.1 MAG: GDSL family lipase [Variovorax sp. SCN 67-20]OJZ14143.1 MAG: GDSL family lipase [Variovorax sp. 67-131]UKI08459.1 GDSL-type esterase/lipase family protein [Variovorax paradoxus]